MAFDKSLSLLALDGDTSGIEAAYLDAYLLAGAVRCIEQQQAEWYAGEIIGSEAVFNIAEGYTSKEDDAIPETPDTAACFLLLVAAAEK